MAKLVTFATAAATVSQQPSRQLVGPNSKFTVFFSSDYSLMISAVFEYVILSVVWTILIFFFSIGPLEFDFCMNFFTGIVTMLLLHCAVSWPSVYIYIFVFG